ncbi:unnamed protein product [Ilex paraguariensis]|uniref:Lysosomal Pro-X carboxypeptidase n=1 Tax=Ilex paraguariensis TaxID=185542 RepID=A0ABC8V0D4_9AQUA
MRYQLNQPLSIADKEDCQVSIAGNLEQRPQTKCAERMKENEHRFYGKSIPLGSMEEAMRNDSIRGCFNSAQVLADYAELLIYLKEKLSAENCPIIVIGASYGGRVRSFILRPSNKSYELKDNLDLTYTEAAQYNAPPTSPVTVVCGGIDEESEGSDILSRIFAGVVAVEGKQDCCDIMEYDSPIQTDGWRWQTCTEMVIPIGRGGNNSMFPPEPFNLKRFIRNCKRMYGVQPRPRWVTSYYGGHDIKLILHRFASNIIFSNGLRDPYSSDGVLKHISDTIIAINTVNGSHCLDIKQLEQSDPEWLVMQRRLEAEVIEGWITKYYADLLAFRKLKDV